MDTNDSLRSSAEDGSVSLLQQETRNEGDGLRCPRFVVGVGVSAIGTEALGQLFEKMPAKSGLAFVVVQQPAIGSHGPTDELLAWRTSIPIRHVENGMAVDCDTIYLIPPEKESIISGGRLLLTDKGPAQAEALPIDDFFCSLAQDKGEGAIGIVLSGTGGDGSRGGRAIYDRGGLVLVQRAKGAKSEGMSKNAEEKGASGFVLPVEEMPGTLLRYVCHPLTAEAERLRDADAAARETIYRLLRDRYGIELAPYKADAVARQTERMLLDQSLSLDEYVKRLKEAPDELNRLHTLVLIEELRVVNEELQTVKTEQRKKTADLAELNADMDGLLASTEVQAVFLDRELTIRKFTPKMAERFNLSPQDVGRRIDHFTHHIGYERLTDDLRQVLKTGQPLDCEIQDRQYRWLVARIVPCRTGGANGGMVLTLIDNDSVKRAENRAKQSERQLAGILDNTPNLVTVKDTEGRYVLMNRAFRAALGVGNQDVAGKTDYDVFPRELADNLTSNDQRVLNEGTPASGEKILPHPDGLRTYLSVKFPIRDEHGDIRLIGAVKTNVTQLKAAEAQAQEAVRQRDRFLAILSHELRNPLSAILNALELLHAGGGNSPSAPGSLGVVDRQAHHMARLLDDVLDVSRFSQGKITIRKEVLDFGALVEETVEAFRPMCESRRHEMRLDRPPEPLLVEGDRVRLSLVVENLLTNAAKYTPDGGQIAISLKREETDVVMSVRDNGRGIPADMLQAVFELFVQSDNTLDRADGGMGVGLTLVRSHVELHGGTIVAKSDGPGQGSEFVVRLPLSTQQESRTSVAVAAPQSAGTRILIVEDNHDSREVLKALLELDGFEVLAAADGAGGLEIIRRDHPHVALIDIGLPDLDGYQVARQIRAEPEHRGICLIALTGYGRPEDCQRVQEAGFDAHFVKPVKVEALYPFLQPRTS